jgi:tetratricopeptide (TPR) repeat protein
VSQGILESRLALTVSMPTGTEQQSDVASEAGRLEITHQRRDRPVLRRLHYHRNRLLARPDRLKERLEHGAELTKIALEIGDYRSVYLGHLARTIAFLNLGQIGLADAESELMLQAALLSREPAGRAMALSYRAGREIMEGRFASGERLLAEARGIGLGRDLSVLCDLCWPALVMPLDEQGRLGELEAVALASKDSASPDGSYAAMLSWLFLRLGRQHDAVFYLERAAGLVIESAQGGDGYLASLAALSEVAAATGDKSRAAELYRLLKPYAERNLVYGAIAVLGSAWRYLGILASTLGRPEEAIGHLERALEFNRRIGARPWALHAASELAGLLARSKRGAGQSRAVGLVGQVIEEAGALGMTKLAAHAIALRSRLTERSADTFAKAVGQPASPYGKNGFGKPHDAQDASRHAPENVQPLQGLQSVDSASKDTTREVESSFAEGSGSLFHREGDYWTLGYEGKVTRVGHRKGLTVIAYLLGHPGRELHALELCSVLDQDGGEVRGRRAPTNSAGAEEAMLDSRAKQSYRQRLRELREEIEEARSHNDGLRAERLEEESAYLTRELARALGIHGRDRKMNADVERARVRITSVIRAAIDHIGRHHRSLARYLMGSIRTGVYAEYRPIKESGPTWQL